MTYLFIIIILLLPTVLIALAMVYSVFLNAPWVPLRRKSIDKMLETAGLKAGERVIDLGSGDGRIVIRAAGRYGAKAVGVELNPFLVLFSGLDIAARGLSHKARIIRQNIFDANISDADLITLYLFPEANRDLENKVMQELKPGARAVSYAFIFPNWQPDKVVRSGAGNIYLYSKK